MVWVRRGGLGEGGWFGGGSGEVHREGGRSFFFGVGCEGLRVHREGGRRFFSERRGEGLREVHWRKTEGKRRVVVGGGDGKMFWVRYFCRGGRVGRWGEWVSGEQEEGVGLGSERGRLRPISTLANFDFGQFLDVEFWPRYKRRKGKTEEKLKKKRLDNQ